VILCGQKEEEEQKEVTTP